LLIYYGLPLNILPSRLKNICPVSDDEGVKLIEPLIIIGLFIYRIITFTRLNFTINDRNFMQLTAMFSNMQLGFPALSFTFTYTPFLPPSSFEGYLSYIVP
jgi:hypothetical protein